MTERDEAGLDHSTLPAGTAIMHRPSRTVVVITVLVLIVIVAAIVALPFYAGSAPDVSPEGEEPDSAQPHSPGFPPPPPLAHPVPPTPQ